MRSSHMFGCGVVLTALLAASGHSQTADKAQAQNADRRYLIVLMGPTGAGKTTQAAFLKKRFGIPTIAVDEVILANPAAMAKYKSAGPPQLNPAVDTMIAEKVSAMDLTKGVALDGYPGSKDQADHLAALAEKLHLPPPIIIQIDLSDDVVRQRLKLRKRADDTPELIEERLKNYHREMDMIRSYYPQANIWTVNGDKPIKEVSDTIEAILRDEIPKP